MVLTLRPAQHVKLHKARHLVEIALPGEPDLLEVSRGVLEHSEAVHGDKHGVIPWCETNGVAVVAYSPFGHNDFPSPHDAAGKVLQAIADAHKATPRQVALSFLTRSPALLAIPKASSAEHAAENAMAGDLTLSAADIAALDKAFPRGPKPRSLPML